MVKKKTAEGNAATRHRPEAPDPHDEALTASATQQRRLLEAQATIDRDYSRLRELETRYRFLLHSSTDAIVMIDGTDLRVFDANPAATSRLGIDPDRLIGAPITSLVKAGDDDPLTGRLAGIRAGSGTESFDITLQNGSTCSVAVSLFRQDGAPVFLMRLEPMHRNRAASVDTTMDQRLATYSLVAPDAMVLTDRTGDIIQANSAFVELVQVATEHQVRGASLGRWLGRTTVDLGVLISNLRQRKSLKLFSTHLRAEYGALTEVEISAALFGEGDTTVLGFTIRDVGRRLASTSTGREDLSKSVAQLTELVGRVPMKEIVGNTAGLIEQMCIKAALDLTRDNRAAAAELLGLSRQSLYIKLRRYEMIDADAPDPA